MAYMIGQCGAPVSTDCDLAMRTVYCEKSQEMQKEGVCSDTCIGCPYNVANNRR